MFLFHKISREVSFTKYGFTILCQCDVMFEFQHVITMTNQTRKQAYIVNCITRVHPILTYHKICYKYGHS